MLDEMIAGNIPAASRLPANTKENWALCNSGKIGVLSSNLSEEAELWHEFITTYKFEDATE